MVVEIGTVIKDFDWKYNDWGGNAMSEADIRERLKREGYATLAADAEAPPKIKTAASRQELAVWTREHTVTRDDDSRITRARCARGRPAAGTLSSGRYRFRNPIERVLQRVDADLGPSTIVVHRSAASRPALRDSF